jgi:hypothetical protein
MSKLIDQSNLAHFEYFQCYFILFVKEGGLYEKQINSKIHSIVLCNV